jgi:uncharacterized protein with HEPN domain
MKDRYVETVYKNIIIHSYKGSNYAYVGNMIFKSVLSAKRHITKTLNKFNHSPELAWRFYIGVLL